jgi:hypothetical protein
MPSLPTFCQSPAQRDTIQRLGTKMGFKYHNVEFNVWAWDLVQNANVKKLHITTYKQQSSVPINRKNK